VVENRDLISSYIPIQGGQSGARIEAVFELYQDVTLLLVNIQHTQQLLTSGVIVVLGCLYCVLLFIVRRADKIMKRQEKDRRSAEEALTERAAALERSNRETRTLHEIGSIILQSLNLKTALDEILGKALAIGGFDIGNIRLLDENTQMYSMAAYRGYRDAANVKSHHQKFTSGATGKLTARMLADKRPVIEENVQEGKGLRAFKKEGVHAAVVFPVRTEERILGVLQIGSRAPRDFAAEDIRLLEAVGNLIGIAVQKAGLFDEVVKAKGKLEETVKELARSNVELQQFAYVASHDLQEPLRMITGYTGLLAKRYKGKLDRDADEFIAYAVEGAQRMHALINDLLAYSRIGTRGEEFAPVDCEMVLAQTLLGLQVAIKECGARVTHDPLPTVGGDGIQLGRLFQNLIGNAIKYRNHNEPVVHVGCERRENDWLFAVEDDGIGIDPQYAEKIFVIFQRLHTSEQYRGTGIGLASCRKIVERHGGKIWVESEPGKGSTFYFTLPIDRAAGLARDDA
jgi:signal transduction histidine kinase